MKKYVVIITSELADHRNGFIDLGMTAFFSKFEDAAAYGQKQCKAIADYPALADFYIYELMEDDLDIVKSFIG